MLSVGKRSLFLEVSVAGIVSGHQAMETSRIVSVVGRVNSGGQFTRRLRDSLHDIHFP